ncbi:MAG TPA: monovalent cation/H+ antiporter complex subunit F [Hyphomonadaceae bacterium]|nr:monovalent cation/H+ antiporter complex subunit F [Hyphomonadaceae bacterium]
MDIAIVYALINFVSTIALMKFFRYGSLSEPLCSTKSGEAADG